MEDELCGSHSFVRRPLEVKAYTGSSGNARSAVWIKEKDAFFSLWEGPI